MLLIIVVFRKMWLETFYQTQSTSETRTVTVEVSADKNPKMHLWPVHTCQTFHIPELDAEGDEDLHILDTLSLQQINTYIMLTKKRILVYQGKPFVPILIYERSGDSLKQFGLNKRIHYNNPLQKISAVNDSSDDLHLNENCIIYVQTNENCLLVYEIKSMKNWINSFKIYGIEPRLTNEAIASKKELIMKLPLIENNKSSNIFHLNIDSGDRNIDDELLTTFDVKNSGKIIQNGFIIEKGKNLVQIMKEMFFIKTTFKKNSSTNKTVKNNLEDHSNDEAENQEAEQMAEEMPIRSCDVILRTVLKFDHNIIDMQVFTKYGEDSIRQELIYLLYSSELCILTLKKDYTLDSKHIISNKNNYQLSFNGKDMFIVSFDEKKESILIINKIDKKNNVIYSKDLVLDNLRDFKLMKVTNFKERYLVLTFDKILIYYDTFLNSIYSKIRLLPTTGLLSEIERDKVVKVDSYDRELLTLLKQNGKFQIYTQWGNLQTEINLSKFIKNTTSDYTSFSFLDNILVVVNKEGFIQMFDFYKQFNSSLTDFKCSSSYTLFNNNNNRITTFSNNRMFQYYLPTNSINNVVSELKYNVDQKLCLIYISNKNIVLFKEELTPKKLTFPEVFKLPIYHSSTSKSKKESSEEEVSLENVTDDEYKGDEYDGWLVFDNMEVFQIEWIDERYAFLHVNDLDNSNNGPSIVCLDFKLLDSSENYRESIVHLFELRIWTYNITNEDEVLYWGCNTFANMAKFKKSNGDNKELFKLGELNVLLRNKKGDVRLETIDILVEENSDQVRSFVRNVVDLSTLTETSISYARNVKWICHCHKGTILAYTGDDELHKISNDKNGLLASNIMFTKLEQIVEINSNKITFVIGNDLVSCDLDLLLNVERVDMLTGERQMIQPLLKQPLINISGEYPIIMDKNLVEFDSLKCVYSTGSDVVNGFKLTVSKNMVLDKVITQFLSDLTASIEDISLKYRNSKYYQFCLEKILCDCIVSKCDDSLYKQRLLDIIALYEKVVPNSKIEIYVNCLRKIDYQQVFELLELTKYSKIDLLIEEILKLDDQYIKSSLLSKIIIIKCNMDSSIDKKLLEITIKQLIQNAYDNNTLSTAENSYKIMHQLISFFYKFNSDKEQNAIDKSFLIDLVEKAVPGHVIADQ